MSKSNMVEVLLVEDSPEDRELALRAFKKANLTNLIEIARDGAEALEFLFCEGAYAGRKFEDGPKLVLLDLKLPKIDGLESASPNKGRSVNKEHSCGSPYLVKGTAGCD